MVRITLDKPYIPIPVPVTAIKYGLLYNWFAATDVRNIAADGWEVPIMDDFNELATYLISNSGDKLKEFGLTYWDTGNNGDNSAGFNGRGSGSRDLGISGFNYLKISSYFWDRNDLTFPYVGYGQLIYNNSNLTGDGGNNAGIGLSIRLIKTTTTLSDGETGTYTGNDGKVYRTICIGTQEWLADNLAETKYRNGDTIPEVTDNSAWAALTTGALCAYNNDWSNVLID